MQSYEGARSALEQLIHDSKSVPPDANEATVRFQLIDRLITDVLGWQKGDVQVERYERGDFSDYECGSPSALVIEAKRSSTHFLVPAGFDKPICRIKTLCESSADVEAAIVQAIDYCRERSIQYGAVCNGTQLAVFIGTRLDGVPSLDGKALVFLSLEEMLARFSDFWNALSPPGLEEDHLGRVLKTPALPPPPLKLSGRILGYPGHKNRNPIATELQILGGLFIDDLADDPSLSEEFLKEAYCRSGALSQYALVSKELLKTRYTTFFEQQTGVAVLPATDKRGTSTQLTADIIAASLSRRPILLVGDVGVGKTTFVKNLIKVEAKEEMKNAIVLYIDFGSKPAVAEELRSYTVGEITKQLREEYDIDLEDKQFVRGVHNQRIVAFGKGIYSELKELDPAQFKIKEIEYIAGLVADKEEHLRLSLEHASKGQKRQIVVFLDNVDQRLPSFQEEVFLIAHSIASNWPVTAFVALRPETFSLSRAKGTLAAYQPRVFTIEPPRVDQVILKRLQFALRLLQDSGRLPGMPAGFSLQSERLELYLKMLIDAFTNRKEIIEFVDNMCSGNVRRALEYIQSFVGSAHVDSSKILEAMERNGRYVLAIHEFIRAVLHKDGEHYDPKAVLTIPNLYDIVANDAREHFSCLLALAYAEHAGQVGGSNGYVERRKIYEFLREQGFHQDQITSTVSRLLEAELLLTPVGLKGSQEERLRITTAGAYMLKKLCVSFAYLDAMIVDTPITDVSTRALIGDERSIEERLARVMTFISYLDESWTQLKTAPSVFEWPILSLVAKSNAEEVRRRIGG